MGSISEILTVFRTVHTSAQAGVVLLSIAGIGGCASGEELVAPPSAELRQQLDSLELQVAAKSKPNWHATESLTVDPGELAAEGAIRGAEAAAPFGCDPQWLFLWVITCPASLAVGAAGGAVYGAATAPSQDEIDAAVVNLDRSLIEARIADEFHQRLVSTIHEATPARVIRIETSGVGVETRAQDDYSTVLALDIEDFVLTREGQISPDLWIDFTVTGAIHEFPKIHPRYERRWRLYANLGDFYTLTDAGAVGLRQEMDGAFDKMAAAIADDLFITSSAKPQRDARVWQGRVVTLYGFERTPIAESTSTVVTSGTLTSYIQYLAEHGNVDAATQLARVTYDTGQLRVLAAQGSTVAALELFDLLSNERSTTVEAWQWLCRAADSGNESARETLATWHRESYWKHSSAERFEWIRDDVGVRPGNRLAFMWYTLASSNDKSAAIFLRGYLAADMTPDEITQAEQMARNWKPGDCPSAEHRLEPPGETAAFKEAQRTADHQADPEARAKQGDRASGHEGDTEAAIKLAELTAETTPLKKIAYRGDLQVLQTGIQMDEVQEHAGWKAGTVWKGLKDGSPYQMTYVSVTGTSVTIRGSDGCTWTRPRGFYAPSTEWANCEGRGGSAIVNLKRPIFPFHVGKTWAFNVDAGRWRTSRECKVVETARVRTAIGENDTFKIVCKDKWNTRTRYYAPKLGVVVYFERHHRKKGQRTKYELIEIMSTE